MNDWIPFPLFHTGKKTRRGERVPKHTELKQNSSLFRTVSTFRLYSFWQTPSFKQRTHPSLLLGHQAPQSCCDAQSAPSLLTATPHTRLQPVCTHLPSFLHKALHHGHHPLHKDVSSSPFFLGQNLIYIFWRILNVTSLKQMTSSWSMEARKLNYELSRYKSWEPGGNLIVRCLEPFKCKLTIIVINMSKTINVLIIT